MQPAMDPFVHPALFYRGIQGYLAGTMPFIREGLKLGDPVAVAVPEPNLRLLRARCVRRQGAVGGHDPGRP
jgi:hypothetical protein